MRNNKGNIIEKAKFNRKETINDSRKKGRDNNRNNSRNIKLEDMVLMAIFAAIITVCSYIQIPFGPIPFTLQNFGVFITAGLLGTKRGIITVITYILLGIIGLPVFRGLGGISVIAGPTGGFIIGFIFVAIIVGIGSDVTKKYSSKKKLIILIITMIVGNVLSMAMGCIQYMIVAHVNMVTAILYCVVPFVATDLVKIALATLVIFRVKLPGNIE